MKKMFISLFLMSSIAQASTYYVPFYNEPILQRPAGYVPFYPVYFQPVYQPPQCQQQYCMDCQQVAHRLQRAERACGAYASRLKRLERVSKTNPVVHEHLVDKSVTNAARIEENSAQLIQDQKIALEQSAAVVHEPIVIQDLPIANAARIEENSVQLIQDQKIVLEQSAVVAHEPIVIQDLPILLSEQIVEPIDLQANQESEVEKNKKERDKEAKRLSRLAHRKQLQDAKSAKDQQIAPVIEQELPLKTATKQSVINDQISTESDDVFEICKADIKISSQKVEKSNIASVAVALQAVNLNEKTKKASKNKSRPASKKKVVSQDAIDEDDEIDFLNAEIAANQAQEASPITENESEIMLLKKISKRLHDLIIEHKGICPGPVFSPLLNDVLINFVCVSPSVADDIAGEMIVIASLTYENFKRDDFHLNKNEDEFSLASQASLISMLKGLFDYIPEKYAELATQDSVGKLAKIAVVFRLYFSAFIAEVYGLSSLYRKEKNNKVLKR